MTKIDIGKVIQAAKQWPSAATVVAIVVLCCWSLYTHFAPGGHAHAADVDDVKSEVNQLKAQVSRIEQDVKQGRIDALEGQIFQAKVQQCASENTELREMYAERVSKLLSDYRQLTSKAIDLPRCDDL